MATLNNHDFHLNEKWADKRKLQVEVQCQVCDELFWKNMGNRCKICDYYGKWGNYYNLTLAYINKDFKIVKWDWPREYKKSNLVFYVDKGYFK